jgi:hypothetical protein
MQTARINALFGSALATALSFALVVVTMPPLLIA